MVDSIPDIGIELDPLGTSLLFFFKRKTLGAPRSRSKRNKRPVFYIPSIELNHSRCYGKLGVHSITGRPYWRAIKIELKRPLCYSFSLAVSVFLLHLGYILFAAWNVGGRELPNVFLIHFNKTKKNSCFSQGCAAVSQRSREKITCSI